MVLNSAFLQESLFNIVRLALTGGVCRHIVLCKRNRQKILDYGIRRNGWRLAISGTFGFCGNGIIGENLSRGGPAGDRIATVPGRKPKAVCCRMEFPVPFCLCGLGMVRDRQWVFYNTMDTCYIEF